MISAEFQEYLTIIRDKLEEWAESIITMVPNFLLSGAILAFTILFGRWFRKVFRRLIRRISKNEAINNLLTNVIYFAIVILGIFISLQVLNLDKTVTSLLAGLGIAGLALGFAFKEIVSNFIAGIYLAIKSPVNVNDIIEYDGIKGIVKQIGLRAINIRTFQGQDVIIPNRLIVEEKYTHYTINQQRRIDLEVGISYGDDLNKVETVTLDAVKKIPFIRHDKNIDFYYKKFGDSAIIFTVRYWVDYLPDNYLIYLRARSEGIKNIKQAYDQNGITITFPIRTLDFGIKGGRSLSDMLGEAKSGSKSS